MWPFHAVAFALGEKYNLGHVHSGPFTKVVLEREVLKETCGMNQFKEFMVWVKSSGLEIEKMINNDYDIQ